MKVSDFFEYMKPGKRGHLIGIGGVSMSALGEVLFSMGINITGSDMNESETVLSLRSKGIMVTIGHLPENVDGADFVVRTAAVHDDNPEIAAAREKGIPVFERTQAWGAIMRNYKNAICVAGTHGKTTTTSMITHILMAAQSDPTVMIGGTLPLLKSGYRVGAGDTIVLESCEYYNSFHSFLPTVAIILNVDADHLDFFKDIDDIKRSFGIFASNVPEGGYIIVNADDKNSIDCIAGIEGRNIVTFGIDNAADVKAINISTGKTTAFDLENKGEVVARVEMKVCGKHNIYNALAAAAAALVSGVEPKSIIDGLGQFRGAGRRVEYKGEYGGADVYDDYAHHPNELRATLAAVRGMGYKRIVCAFQPHTYTRTKALFDDFVEALSLADKVYLAEIYAAREKNTIGISSRDIADKIPGSVYCPSFDELEEKLRAEARPGDIILTVGAGDIYKVGERIVKK
ncbi:MAG: UDP-N-acetylmuramate--L-alanine ligase [Clostridiales bacterium]|nr:UDP-N-acetylmuramate--L-alanine ligase [Clostridiales bacterium]